MSNSCSHSVTAAVAMWHSCNLQVAPSRSCLAATASIAAIDSSSSSTRCRWCGTTTADAIHSSSSVQSAGLVLARRDVQARVLREEAKGFKAEARCLHRHHGEVLGPHNVPAAREGGGGAGEFEQGGIVVTKMWGWALGVSPGCVTSASEARRLRRLVASC